MASYDKYFRTLPTRYGLILFACLVGFFLLMRLLNLANIFELRVLNFIFVFIVLRSAIHTFARKAQASYYEDFIDFFWIGMRTASVGIISFAAFMAIYLDLIDPAFMEILEREENAGGIISPVIAAFAILLEGMASAMICSFIIIQWRKSRTVEKPLDQPDKLRKEARN